MLIAIVRLLLVSLLLIQTYTVQTWTGQQVAGYLADAWGTEVTIGEIEIDFFNRLNIKNIYIEDLKGDTLLYAANISSSLTDYNTELRTLDFDVIRLENARINLKKYADENHLNFQFIADYFASDDTTSSPAWEMDFEDIQLVNTHFSYKDEHVISDAYGINFSDLDAKAFNANLHQFRLEGDTIFTTIQNISLADHSGFVLDSLSGATKISPAGILIDSALIKTPHTRIASSIYFLHNDYADYSHFIDSVEMQLAFEPTAISMTDLAYFVPALEGMERDVILEQGRVRGTVSHLGCRSLYLILDENTFFKGSITLEGLPDIENAFITAVVKRMETTKGDLERIQLPPFTEEHYVEIPADLGNIDDLGTIKFKGNFTGFLNEFVAFGTVATDLGKLKTDVEFLVDSATNQFHYDGTLKVMDFNLGRFYSIPEVGALTGNFDLTASGFTASDFNGFIDGNINNIYLNGYTYENFEVKDGEFESNHFKGTVITHDENLDMVFTGELDFKKKIPKMDFEADVFQADLVKLNLLPDRDSSARLTGRLEMNMEGLNIDHMQGTVSAIGLQYDEAGEEYCLNDFVLTAQGDEADRLLKVTSDFVDVTIAGQFNFEGLGTSLKSFATSILPSLFEDPYFVAENDEVFTIDVNLKNLDEITRLLETDIEISRNSKFTGRYNSLMNDIGFGGSIAKITMGDRTFSNIRVDAEKIVDMLFVDVRADNVFFSDSLNFENFLLHARAYQDDIETSIKWNNANGAWGKIKGNGYLLGTEQFEYHFFPSTVHTNGAEWHIGEDGVVLVDSSAIDLGLMITSGEQKVTVKGKISEDKNDKLRLVLKKFKTSILDAFVGGGVHFGGEVNGSGYVADLYGEPFFTSDFKVTEFAINNERFGNFTIKNEWDNIARRLSFDGGLIDNKALETIGFHGEYHMEAKDGNNFDLHLNFDRTNLHLVQPFLPADITSLDGFLSGGIDFKGSPSEPLLKGFLKLEEGGVGLGLTNTYYSCETILQIEPDWIGFDHIPIYDNSGNQGYATGTIVHSNFADWNFDVFMEFNNLMCLNTTEEMNNLYYGRAFATGTASISGYTDNLEINVDAKSERGTRMAFPLSGPAEITDQDFVTFVSHDTTQVEIEEEVDLTGITMNFELDVTPDAEVKIIFDDKVGDMMRGRGKGHIQMLINTIGDFQMFGQFEVEEGDYLFTLQNIINKKFLVEKGGTIKWYGDPYNAELDLDAVYNVHTSLYDLIPEEAYRKRVPVECHMKMTQKLLSPEIHFDIVAPKVDEGAQNVVKSLRNNEQELNKQVFSLMVLNRFLPLASSTGAASHGGSGALGSSSSELLSNQLSNWLSQISNDFDIGINYRPGDDITSKELEVALSTQLFDGKIEVSGNFGVSGDDPGGGNQEQSNLVGDFYLEYKISETEDGQVRLKAFNESNEFDITNTNQAAYTQGIGTFYRVEFDSGYEFWQKIRNLFRKKKNRITDFEKKNKRKGTDKTAGK